MNLAKQGYAAYESSQAGHQGQDQSAQVGIQGSAALNSSDNQRPAQGGRKLLPLAPSLSAEALQQKADGGELTSTRASSASSDL